MTSFSLILKGSTIEVAGSAGLSTSSTGASPASSTPQGEGGPTTPGPATPGASTQGPATPGGNGTPGGAGETVSPGNPMQSVMMFALIGAVIWFLIFAPERKTRKKREEMLGAVKKGDKIVTTGGMHAEVVEVKENTVILKAGETRLTFSRASIHEIRQPKEPAADA